MQVGATSVSQQDATRFGRAREELAVSSEYLEHSLFDQDEAVIVRSSQD